MFPKVAERAPETAELIAQLDREHTMGEANVRQLQHLLLAWELLGESRRDAFAVATKRFPGFYLEHMRLEETVILPTPRHRLVWARTDHPTRHGLPLIQPDAVLGGA